LFRHRHRNLVDDTTWEFLHRGWWVFHALAIGAVYWLGMRRARAALLEED